MGYGSPTPDIRSWLIDHGFNVSNKGSISAEMYDVHTAITEGFATVNTAISYVFKARKWMEKADQTLTRSQGLTPDHFRLFDATRFIHTPSEDTEDVQQDSADPIFTAVPPHKPIARPYTGTAFVTHQMNLGMMMLFRTAMEEAVTISYSVFESDGSQMDETYDKLLDVHNVVKMANHFLLDLVKTFHPEEAGSISDTPFWQWNMASVDIHDPESRAEGLHALRRILGGKYSGGETIENKDYPILGTHFEKVELLHDSPHIGHNCLRDDEAGWIEANGFEEITSRPMLLVHFYNGGETTHEWCYVEELVISS
jgi:hypothetical protein